MTFLKTLWEYRAYVLGAVLIAATLYLAHVFADRADLKAENKALVAQSVADTRKHNAIVQGMTNKATNEKTLNAKELEINSSINEAARVDNRPVSPVIRAALVGLRQLEAE